MKNLNEEQYKLLMSSPMCKKLIKYKMENLPKKSIVIYSRWMGKTQLRKLNKELGFEFIFKNKDD